MTDRGGWNSRRRWALSSRPGFGADERGMTIIELAIAVVVFAIISSGVVLAMGGSLGLARNNRNRSIAANLASAEMDSIRSAEFETLPVGRVTSTRAVDGVDYTIQRDSEWVIKNATTGACDSPSGDRPAYLNVVVQILWPNMSGVKPVTSQTVISPPVGAYDAAKGHLAVKVIDRDAAPASGHQVTIDGPSGTQTQTTADGCAFFAFIDPGSYDVSVDSVGYVDGEGVQNSVQIAGLNAGGITSIQFDYDRAAALALTLGTDAVYPVPAAIDVPVVVANTSLALGEKIVAGTGPARTVDSLFPYLNGYQVWLGDCSDNDPEGQDAFGTPFYPTGQRESIAVSPGQTSSANVGLAEVEVTVLDDDGDPLSNRQVDANHAADTRCTGGYSLDLGQTDALGLVFVSLPYGTWEIEAVGEDETIVLDPTAPSPYLVTVEDD